MAILSWNHQGLLPLGGVFTENTFNINNNQILDNNLFNIGCFQEVGTPHEFISRQPQRLGNVDVRSGTINTRIRRNSINFSFLYAEWNRGQQNGNDRCSLAIMARGNNVFDQQAWADGNFNHRPIIAIRRTVQEPWVGCIHAPSGGRQNTIRYIEWAINRMNTLNKPWILVGDFNIDPQNQALQNQNINIVHTGLATHQNGGNLDWMITSFNNNNVRAFRANALKGSDHLAVAYNGGAIP